MHPNFCVLIIMLFKLILKNIFKSNILRDLEAGTALKIWRDLGPSLIPDKPRHMAVATFRLATGHDCLPAHLKRLGILIDSTCPLCDSGEELDRDHLLRCSSLLCSSEESRYWEARSLFRQ